MKPSYIKFTLLLIFSFALQKTYTVYAQATQTIPSPIITISIPKCGTWMLEKTICYLTKKQNALWKMLYYDQASRELKREAYNGISLFTPSLDIFNHGTNLQDTEYIITHLKYEKTYEEILKKKTFKIVFIVRDPRDQLISRIFYIQNNKTTFPGLQHLSFNELLLGLIGVDGQPHQKFEDLLSSHLSYITPPENNVISNIMQFYEAFLPWKDSPLCYTTTFEKLVGPKGKGDLQTQIQEVTNIANHIGLHLDPKEIQNVADKVFGETHTFREGKIGAWKKYFTQENKEAFKKVAGQLLIDLGYEKDFNW